MLQWFKEMTSEYGWTIQFAAIFGLLLLFIKRVRSFFTLIYKWFYLLGTAPFKNSEDLTIIKNDMSHFRQHAEKTEKDVSQIKDFIGYNGGGGMMDHVGFILGFQTNDFWLRRQPSFICDIDGRNLQLTHGYCLMLKVSSRDELIGMHWKSYVDKESSGDFLKEFREATERGETFRSHIRFYDSFGNDIGLWMVHAIPISDKKALTARYMGTIYPYDGAAIEKAKLHDFELTPPL